MKARRDVFQAIADPTRREILILLLEDPANLNAISKRFDMSRQAVSLHVQILQECKLISIDKRGRERICRVQPESLAEVDHWVSHFRIFWSMKLKALGDAVQETKQKTSEKK